MMPHADRYPAKGVSRRVWNRLPVKLRLQLRGATSAKRAAGMLPIEELTGPDPDLQDHAPPADDWTEAALLESYELEDDDTDDADLVEIVTRARLGAPPEYSRFVEAMREKARPAAVAAPGARPVASTREECRRCGVPGFKGCEHQAPCPPVAPLAFRSSDPNHASAYRRKEVR